MRQSILVTGGTGYIGSHTVVQLLKNGESVVILDNLCNSKAIVLDRVETITGRRPEFIEGDVRNRAVLRDLFHRFSIEAVLHFAGLKAVAESEAVPLKYFDTNVAGSISLFEEMEIAGVRTVVFSSSATVYGNPGYVRYHEKTPLAPLNAYGQTKLMVEDILRNQAKARQWRIALLRYFNPAGAHASGLIGEDPNGTPTNLMPSIAQVAAGRREKLCIFGGDYPTRDGTGLRDYIHVEDLAAGHLAALTRLREEHAALTLNLGRGQAFSVLEIVTAFEKASGKKVPFQIAPRRPGDLAEYYADPALAHKVLGWQSCYGIERMCEDAWRWQKNNPRGYG